jgi:hypothetical protein
MVKSRRMKWECSKNGEKKTAYVSLVREPEGKRQLVRPRCRRVDNIKMNLGDIG